MSLFDIYNDVSDAVENKKPKEIALGEEHIDFFRCFLLHRFLLFCAGIFKWLIFRYRKA